jgi:hypothetical protein
VVRFQEVTSSRRVNAGGLPTLTSGLSCFVGSCEMDLRPVPSYAASTGIWSLSLSPRVGSQQFAIHRWRGFCQRLRLRECTLVQHGSIFTRGPSPLNPPKRSSVRKVRYLHDTLLTHACQVGILPAWKRFNEPFGSQSKTYKRLQLSENSMGLPQIVKRSALPCNWSSSGKRSPLTPTPKKERRSHPARKRRRGVGDLPRRFDKTR